MGAASWWLPCYRIFSAISLVSQSVQELSIKMWVSTCQTLWLNDIVRVSERISEWHRWEERRHSAERGQLTHLTVEGAPKCAGVDPLQSSKSTSSNLLVHTTAFPRIQVNICWREQCWMEDDGQMSICLAFVLKWTSQRHRTGRHNELMARKATPFQAFHLRIDDRSRWKSSFVVLRSALNRWTLTRSLDGVVEALLKHFPTDLNAIGPRRGKWAPNDSYSAQTFTWTSLRSRPFTRRPKYFGGSSRTRRT